jgi:hypothetical protein
LNVSPPIWRVLGLVFAERLSPQFGRRANGIAKKHRTKNIVLALPRPPDLAFAEPAMAMAAG